MPELKTREELIVRINEIFYKNGLEYITAEQTNTVLQLLLANQPILGEMDYVEKLGAPVEDRLLLCSSTGGLKLSDILVSTLTGIDFSRTKFTTEGGVAIKLRNLTPGSLYKGTICTPVAGSRSWQRYIKDFKPVGASLLNSDNYCYYMMVRCYYAGGTMNFQVNIYKDQAMTQLVGHVPDTDLVGEYIGTPQDIIEDNASGLTGTITNSETETPTNELYEDYTFAPINAVEQAVSNTCFKHMVAYEDIAFGYEGWIVTAGAADVLIKDGTAAAYGNFAYFDASASGRARAAAALDFTTLANFIQYFGRFTESKIAGADVLARMILK